MSDGTSAEKKTGQGMDAVTVAQLEYRIAMLEQSLASMNAYNQTATKALTHVLERLKGLEPITGWAAQFERKFENYRSTQTLARASKIYPKERSVVFVSKGYFGDNVKYAFLAFCDYARGKNVAAHFLTDDPRQRDLVESAGLSCLFCAPGGWPAHHIRTLLGAKVVVLNDNFHPYVMQNQKAFGLLQGAKVIQLWHGIPIKDIGLRYLFRADNVLLEELIASCGPYDVFVAPAAAARDEWAQMFAFREFAALGYPRNDVLLRETTARDLLNVDAEVFAQFEAAQRFGKPSILYAPTFRDDAASGWFDKAGIAALADHARTKGYVFAVNLHPYEQNAVEEFRTRYPGIRFVSAGTDIYPVIKHADVLITDYSSLAFDYLLLDRPLIYYRPDHDYYMTHSRGFIEGREKLTPGALVATPDELNRAVEVAAGFVRAPETDPARTVRLDLRTQLFDHVDAKAGERVCELIMGQIESD